MYLGSTRADRFTNGFPNVLVAEILDVRDMNTNHTLRLIPEMTFTCNGTIVGFTVAGRQRTERSMNPIVQIWRQNSSQNIYYRASVEEIVVDKETCGEISTVFQGSDDTDDQVWNLNATNRVPVQAGDILGLLLPPTNDTSFQLSFARVSRGPTNYIFEDQKEVLAVDLCNTTGTNLNQELPQLAVQVKSGKHYRAFSCDVTRTKSVYSCHFGVQHRICNEC